ncbi:MAG: mechanosensitive ion channel family protein [Gemmatimonadetes bacterium]|nr:mechanosensitive ion channel family protein [Gemmatimonadota bacterium]
MKICDTTNERRPMGGNARRRRIASLLLLSGLSATAFLPSSVRTQETGAVADAPAAAANFPSDTLPSIADRARTMLDTLRATSDSVATLRATRLAEPDVDLDFLRLRALEQVGQMQRVLRSLAYLLGQVSPDSLPADSVRTFLLGYMGAHLDLLDRSFALTVQDYEKLRRERSTVTAQEIGRLESEIADVRAWADTLIRYQEWALGAADSLQLDVTDRWAAYAQLLLAGAENTVGRLQIAVAERDRLTDRIRVAERTNAPASEVADLKLRLTAAETRIGAIGDNLTALSGRLERRGFESATYRETLIRSTGEVTGDVLDPQVFLRLVRRLSADLWQSVRSNAGTVFVRLLIVIFFVVLLRVLFIVLWWVAQKLRLVRGSRLVRDLLGRILRPMATLTGLIVGLSVIGVQTTTLLAGLGVAGLVIGFALQDSLSNLFAGVAILASRPYDVDDIVEAAGVVGKVRAMGLWNTTIVTFDARRLLVPNKNIWGSNVENRSAEVNRRVEAIARIGYETDLQAAMAVLEQLLREDDRVLDEPAPTVWVSRMAESWVEVKLWPWVKTADWWSMHSDLPRLIRLELAEKGIPVPVPRRDVTTRAAGTPVAEGDTGPAHTT